MYILHIGKDVAIKSKDIISILNIKSLEKKKSLENVCKNLHISDNIIDVSDDNQKSLIITSQKGEVKGYISNISSMTLAKRITKMKYNNL